MTVQRYANISKGKRAQCQRPQVLQILKRFLQILKVGTLVIDPFVTRGEDQGMGDWLV